MRLLPDSWAKSTQQILVLALIFIIALFGISFFPPSEETINPQYFLWYVYGPILIVVYSLAITSFLFSWVVIIKKKMIKGISYLAVSTGLCLFYMVVLPNVYPL